MTPIEIRQICHERLTRWTERLVELHATPAVLIAIGHDHKAGNVVLLTLEDITDEQLRLFLLGAKRIGKTT